MRVVVVRAWPRRHEAVIVELDAPATAADAVRASGLPMDDAAGVAVHGIRVTLQALLADGDRVEILRPLQRDPAETRRLRAAGRAR
jgi:uncharacterized protein